MANVVANAQVAHLWANRAQDEARSHNGNFYFRGDTIYSYGAHFPIARHVETPQGRAVLFTGRDYSVTTSGHKSDVRAALRGQRIVMVPDLGHIADHAETLKGYAEHVQTHALKAKRARQDYSKEWQAKIAREWVDSAAAFAELYGLTWPDLMADHAAVLAEAERLAAGSREEREAQYRIEREALRASREEKLAAWLAGEGNEPPAYSYEFPPQARVRGDVVQTTWGAVVPLADARRLVRIAARFHSGDSTPALAADSRIGAFHLDLVDPEGNVTIGCHRIAWSELVRATCQGDRALAAELGFDCGCTSQAEAA